jgi:hypothetical protein
MHHEFETRLFQLLRQPATEFGGNDKIGIVMKYRHGNMLFFGLLLIIVLASVGQNFLQKQYGFSPIVGLFGVYLPLVLGLLMIAKMAKAFHISITAGDWMDAN